MQQLQTLKANILKALQDVAVKDEDVSDVCFCNSCPVTSYTNFGNSLEMTDLQPHIALLASVFFCAECGEFTVTVPRSQALCCNATIRFAFIFSSHLNAPAIFIR